MTLAPISYQVFPAMAADAAVSPFSARALLPLADAERAPLLLRCLALRLVVEGWLLTGRGWQRVEAAINGYAPYKSDPPLQLRLTRAAMVRSVLVVRPLKAAVAASPLSYTLLVEDLTL